MIPEEVYELCHANESVSSELAKNPSHTPGDVRKKLYGRFEQGVSEHKRVDNTPPTPECLKMAAECGKWGTIPPSELFLQIYHDVLGTIEKDPMCGMVSPPLLGSCGVVPLTIIAPLTDICRHMSNCIARAKKEVFLATNYWKHSEATRLITNSMKELSRRAGERGERVVVKVMYDRGNPKQVYDNHQVVPESAYTTGDVKLPAKEEIPNIDLEVVNYHRPVFGTFHSKFMVVDREVAIISSNNIQENDNVEMMIRLEGPIVDSFYEVCLNSWHRAMQPMLPMLNSRAADRQHPSFAEKSHGAMFDENGRLRDLTPHDSEPVGLSGGTHPTEHAAQKLNSQNSEPVGLSQGTQPTEHTASKLNFKGGQTNGPEQSLNSVALTANHEALPGIATAIDEQKPLDSVVQTANHEPLPEHTADDPHYDPDIASEVLRAQSVLSPRNGESRMQCVTRHLNLPKDKDLKGTAPECAPGDEMTTFIPLPQHNPVPMAMVCRKPWGAPNHSSVHVPQDAAFTGALRYAKKSVFIQTPNLNAEPLIPEIIAAVKRGVNVTYYVCLGYNDAGELLPFQNGTNEMIAHQLYSALSTAQKQHLNIYNYVGKDQNRPIHNKFKQRSCHIKLLIADGHIGIQGNGNQDTQSWFHSQEINVMIDSEAVCAAWIEGIRRNQNTHIYGAVAKEGENAGCWLDENGQQAEGAIGTDPGKFSWAKGIVGAVQRVRGAGGF